MTADAAQWLATNRQRLLAATARVREALHTAGARRSDPEHRSDPQDRPDVEHRSGEAGPRPARPRSRRSKTAQHEPPPPALDILTRHFGLSSFEHDVLALAAGFEIDPEMGAACAAARNAAGHVRPTVGLALEVLPQAHWSAFSPEGPLRRWQLLDLGSGETLTERVLTIDPRILLYLLGVNDLDERLRGRLMPLPGFDAPQPSRVDIARRIVSLWLAERSSQREVVLLAGPVGQGKTEVASVLGGLLQVPVFRMQGELLPVLPAEVEQLARLMTREALLSAFVLMLDCEAAEDWDAPRLAVTRQFIESVAVPLIVQLHKATFVLERPSVRFEVARLRRGEQKDIWRDALPKGARMEQALDRITFQFALERQAVHAALADAVSRSESAGTPLDEPTLWDACRVQARPRLDDLAERIDARSDWDDLVLPPAQKDTLRTMVVHVRERSTVYGRWGFGEGRRQGLGINAVFAGPSGTGKTMAAEVLAKHLGLDLFRIDLSAVISKYIGETEKNLRRVFDAAEGGGAILAFDEADALFGKRTEVKDSHDRYANIEVSYLLQKIEAYQGLAILTTNYREALDSAFLRRLRFIVTFPFPDQEMRAEIWRRAFPPQTPIEALDYRKLGRLNVSGGLIRNIALAAAFLAAEQHRHVTMAHVLAAARQEYRKQDQILTNAEIEGWVA